VEKFIYDGPWDTQDKLKGCKKDTTAPRRPMSAYLDYSKTFRSQIIRDNPHVRDNKEISKILGKLWNNAPEQEKRPFIERELRLRAIYNEKMKQWREERDRKLAEERLQREAKVNHAIDSGTCDLLMKSVEMSRVLAKTHNPNNLPVPFEDNQIMKKRNSRPLVSQYRNSYTDVNESFPRERIYSKYSARDVSSQHDSSVREEFDQTALHISPESFYEYNAHVNNPILGVEDSGVQYCSSFANFNEASVYSRHPTYNTTYVQDYCHPEECQNFNYSVAGYYSEVQPQLLTYTEESNSHQFYNSLPNVHINESSRFTSGFSRKYPNNPVYMPNHPPVNYQPNYNAEPAAF